MPANLSPDYKAAEAAYRKARDPRERLEGLREMLRTIPKHKGTEHLQADIKARIKDLSEELEGGRKGGAHGGPSLVVRPEGAAQAALIGPPSSGKSSLHSRLTGSGAHVAAYPFTTQYPEPGMMPHEDIRFQLVDLPALSREHPVPWLAGALQTADAALLVIDLADPACLEQTQAVRSPPQGEAPDIDGELESGRRGRRSFRANASDADPCEQGGRDSRNRRRARGVSRAGRISLSRRGPSPPRAAADWARSGSWLFEKLDIVRIYTKTPGHPPDKGRPFTLRRGQTVDDLARLIHQDLVGKLKYARIWGLSGFDGQHVGHEHVLADRDVVELHS